MIRSKQCLTRLPYFPSLSSCTSSRIFNIWRISRQKLEARRRTTEKKKPVERKPTDQKNEAELNDFTMPQQILDANTRKLFENGKSNLGFTPLPQIQDSNKISAAAGFSAQHPSVEGKTLQEADDARFFDFSQSYIEQENASRF